MERTRSAIVAAARTEFAIRGYGGATIGGIASAAGLSESTVYEHYGSKAGLAAASFAGGHAEAVAALRADGAAPLTRLHNHLGRVYALLVADRAGTKALFDAVMEVTVEGPPTSPTDPRVLVPLPDVMVPVISDAQAEGELGAGVDPWTIAGHLVGLLMLNVLMNPMEPEAACRRIEDLAFGGLYRESIGGDGPAGRV
ncbi:MAG: TetR/AcrR family transcriptional regulator [Acidimicrobiia bacterium]|nr:TetR/AcrR family transcriptional regulator [Acidimicrobiia bacterium]